MRFLRIAALGILLSVSAGCITFLTEIHLARDGSGTLVQTLSMNPQAFKGAMQEIAKGMGGSGEVKETTEKKEDAKGPFSKTDLAAKAKELGDGVEFVSADPIESETAQGVRVTYRFRDINTLYLNPKPAAALGAEGAGRSSAHAVRFRFERSAGRAVLTAVVPPDEKKKEEAPPAASTNAEMDAQQMAMMKQMFKGMHIGMSIDVDGAISSTTASYRDGNRITLIDIDMDPLLADPATLKKMNARLSSAMGDDRKTAAALSEFPGVKIETKPEIRVEFR
jgi:hypothetical protein